MSHRHRIRTTLLAALITFAAAGAQAAERVYKWVDADGVVHFEQQPPAQAEAEAIKVQKGFSTVDPEATAEPTAEEKQAAADAETCRVATENFTMLSADGNVKRTDEYGDTHILTPEEKASERARAEAAMKRFCP
ncbi:MAG: hypothetical protein CALGDGBN_01578 [Pseudomonadales bacterium]|nr:hypothetical protein [Pseudomonadales bacterium]